MSDLHHYNRLVRVDGTRNQHNDPQRSQTYHVCPIIHPAHDLANIESFVICNNGYTIERYIHGMDANYNDIQEWKYRDLISVFGGDSRKAKTYQVKTKQEAEDLFQNKEFGSAAYLQVQISGL